MRPFSVSSVYNYPGFGHSQDISELHMELHAAARQVASFSRNRRPERRGPTSRLRGEVVVQKGVRWRWGNIITSGGPRY